MPALFTIVCASTSDMILSANLAASPVLSNGVPLHVERCAPSAAIAYNRAIDATDSEFLIFAHQDVYLPKGWDALLTLRLTELTRRHPDWAVAGAFGVAENNQQFGPVWSSSLGQIVGCVPTLPVPVVSFDEMLIVLRRASGLRFDASQPGWHLYGTDIVCRARAAGMGAFAIGLPCIHNDQFHAALGPDFTASYRWMQAKWSQFLPMQTPVTKISRTGLHLMRERWNMRKSRAMRQARAIDPGVAPGLLAARCGWADLTPAVV